MHISSLEALHVLLPPLVKDGEESVGHHAPQRLVPVDGSLVRFIGLGIGFDASFGHICPDLSH